MKWSPSCCVKYCGPDVASAASASALQERVCTGAPFNVVGYPAAPTQRSPLMHWSIIPSTGQLSSSKAIKVPNIGRPAMKLMVPSIGSITQRRPDVPVFSPNSSPMMPSRGHSASSIRRIALSAARSASVTGEASAFDSWVKADRKNGRIACPAASAKRLARRMSAGVISRTGS